MQTRGNQTLWHGYKVTTLLTRPHKHVQSYRSWLRWISRTSVMNWTQLTCNAGTQWCDFRHTTATVTKKWTHVKSCGRQEQHLQNRWRGAVNSRGRLRRQMLSAASGKLQEEDLQREISMDSLLEPIIGNLKYSVTRIRVKRRRWVRHFCCVYTGKADNYLATINILAKNFRTFVVVRSENWLHRFTAEISQDCETLRSPAFVRAFQSSFLILAWPTSAGQTF